VSSTNNLQRYARHFPIIGLQGQQKLSQAKILCIGAGGLSCPALLYLTAAGVGTIGIIDDDKIELSNLQRQILFGQQDIHSSKVNVAAARLKQQNDAIQIHAHHKKLNDDNAHDLVKDYDVVIDGSDNYKTRYLINDVCHQQKKPLISASIFQFQGQCSVFNYNDGPCYRCLYECPPPDDIVADCAQGGVLGVLPGIMGTIQATEAIKIILTLGEVLSHRLLIFDALKMQFKEYSIHKNKMCPLCHGGELSTHLFLNKNENATITTQEITPQELYKLLNENKSVFLLDVREPFEREICHIGGEHIPVNNLQAEQLNIPKDNLIVVYCKTGKRSRSAATQLKQSGFQYVVSLEGGIKAWANEIDSTIAIY
jgi:molybdopterin/thiamine biosynthesis adenylyltransferase/rhodanese-related sulfurtransferase